MFCITMGKAKKKKKGNGGMHLLMKWTFFKLLNVQIPNRQ